MLRLRQLQQKKQAEAESKSSGQTEASGEEGSNESISKVSAAHIRLQKDITELDLPATIKLIFPDPTDIFNFKINIKPQQGYYRNGTFSFKVEVNNNFPMEPPKIKCLQRIYHPNIDLEGNICLNILREDWSPVLNLNSVLIGLNFLLLEPNPNDPLNKDAANLLVKNKSTFAKNVKHSMEGGYIGSVAYDNVVTGK